MAPADEYSLDSEHKYFDAEPGVHAVAGGQNYST
jgi:hypothetical protein